MGYKDSEKSKNVFYNVPLTGVAAENPELFATLVRTWRQSQGFTQQAFADKTGESQRNISQIESGKRKPTRDTINRMAEVLKVPPVDVVMLHNLLGYSYTPDPSFAERPQAGFADPLDEYLDSLVDDKSAMFEMVFDDQYRILRSNLLSAFTLSHALEETELDLSEIMDEGMISFPLLVVHPKGHVATNSSEPDAHRKITYSRVARERVSDPHKMSDLYDRMTEIGEPSHIPQSEFPDVPDFTSQKFTFAHKDRAYRIYWQEVNLSAHHYPQGSNWPKLILATGTPADAESAQTMCNILVEANRASIRPEVRYLLDRSQ